MAALRWFFLSLFCFGGGAVGAFALHPPQLGIPDESATDLRSRLALIQQYASEGRCPAVLGQLQGAESTIRKLSPDDTSATIQQQLQDAVQKVRREATSECLRVAASKETQSAEAQAEPTTPSPTPTAEPSATPSATPDGSSTDGGAPDPGSGEGAATPTPEGTTPGGGVTIPDGQAGAALRQGITEARRQYNKARDEVQHTLDQLQQEAQR
jgi:hypothetical protein